MAGQLPSGLALFIYRQLQIASVNFRNKLAENNLTFGWLLLEGSIQIYFLIAYYTLLTIQLTRFEGIVQYLIYFHRKTSEMDLQWLLPQQIEQILRLCDLSHIQDASVAANILEQHQWNLEYALNDLVGQNDQAIRHQAAKVAEKLTTKPALNTNKIEEYNYRPSQSGFELDEQLYHQLDNPTPNLPNRHSQHKHILSEQNKEYEEMEKSYIAKLAEDEEWNQYLEARQQEFNKHKEQFASHIIERPVQIKFRLASKVEMKTFDSGDKIGKVFKYVSGHLRSAFQNKYSEFDLTQTFPFLSLKERLDQSLESLFGDSNGEVLIVKEL